MIAAALLLACVAQADERLAVLARSIVSPKEIERVSAVQQLALLRSKDAWLLIVGALKDESSRVADEAELALTKCDDPAVVEELSGKSGVLAPDAWIAVHAVGALTGGKDRPRASIEAALGAKHDEARAVLFANLERAAPGLIAAGPVPKAIDAALEKAILPLGKGGELQASALLALAAFEPARCAEWFARAEAKQSPAWLCALMSLAGADTSAGAQKVLLLGSTHPDRAVRAATVAAIGAHPTAERLAVLVDMFAAEKNARLLWTIDDHLERISGLVGGGKADFWKGWVAKLGPDWKPATGDPTRRYAPAGDTQAPKLAGMPILSGAIAILIDLSGSTWEKRPDGTTVKDRLDKELETALRALPESARFNVIPYTNEPIPWEKKLQPATPANVGKALKSFANCKASGKGNFWDAAMLALADPDVDTILVLTDGAPTGGRRWHIDLMRDRFLEQNRFRRVVLDAVLVDASKFLRDKWDGWCMATGGRFLALDT